MALNDKCVDLIKDADFRSKEEADSGNDVDRTHAGLQYGLSLVLIQHEISAHLEEEETCHAS
jgi:hypothetical protein